MHCVGVFGSRKSMYGKRNYKITSRPKLMVGEEKGKKKKKKIKTKFHAIEESGRRLKVEELR